MRRLRKPSPALALAILALAALAAGFAVAAVPDSKGRITACYAKKGGKMRILAKGSRCRRGEKLIRWNQQGRPGAAGQTGAPGTPGQQGQQGPTGPQGATGADATSMLTGNTENVPLNPGTTFLAPSGPSQTWGAVTFADMLSPNVPIQAHDLGVQLGGPAGANESYKITLLVNGVDTALTCTVAGDTDTTCGDSTAQITVAARTRICFKVEVSAGAVSRRVLFAWRATNPP